MSPAANEPQAEQKSPEELREDIEQTREELGDTVEALAEKSDVKAQAQDRIAAVKETAQQKREEFTSKVRGASPEGAAESAQQVTSAAKQNPLPLAAAGAFLVGFLIGRASSR